MANDPRKMTDIPAVVAVAPTDRLLVLTNPSTTPAVKTIPVANLIANSALTFRLGNTIPANSTSNGTPGTIAYSANYIYVCVANNTWTRATLSSW